MWMMDPPWQPWGKDTIAGDVGMKPGSLRLYRQKQAVREWDWVYPHSP